MTLPGCNKSRFNNPLPTMVQLQVASDFTWESSRLINVSIGIDLMAENIGTLSRVSV
jgi:hypothetical protein